MVDLGSSRTRACAGKGRHGPAVAATSIARLVVSHIVLPAAPVDKTADTLADLAQRFLDPPRA
ncbi:hypothetical protein [Micromonospora aurantiaca (nom. illeg.)]|uniref:hypothetical protein n=1 Tax=Micromonospora aurantiaca (nom. illeg.) TaxID=47850 RepID=UPI0033F0C455